MALYSVYIPDHKALYSLKAQTLTYRLFGLSFLAIFSTLLALSWAYLPILTGDGIWSDLWTAFALYLAGAFALAYLILGLWFLLMNLKMGVDTKNGLFFQSWSLLGLTLREKKLPFSEFTGWSIEPRRWVISPEDSEKEIPAGHWKLYALTKKEKILWDQSSKKEPLEELCQKLNQWKEDSQP